MKNIEVIFNAFKWVAIMGFAALVFWGAPSLYASAKEVKKESQELIEALKVYSAEQRDEAIDRSRSAMESLDERIDALKKRIDKNWDKMDKAARENARKSLEEIGKQREKVAERYESFKGSAADAWENMKQGFSDAYKALYDAWERSDKELGTEK
jgi:uncharacterized protein (DUF3084 family)